MDWNHILQTIDARIERAVSRVRLAQKAVLSAVTATTKAPECDAELLADERIPGMELYQQAGFRSIPIVGAEAIVIQVGGRGGHRVVIATADRANAPTDLVAGEVAIYSTGGAKVVCKLDGSVVINDGTQGVARTTDSCSPSAGMTTWITAVSSALQTLTGGAFPPPTDATYSITGGSTTVKAG